ncbi:MAG: Slp family lipoprotein [Aquimonas sp.]|nr:Slp family lipoprotein [Aquimonas sp.]
MSPRPLAALLVLALSACAAAPRFSDLPERPSPAPRDIAAHIEANLDRRVLWGAMVIELHETADGVELELLGFPLDAQLRPVPRARDGGRFIARPLGPIDPEQAVPGRFLTLSGVVVGAHEGELHGSPNAWPVVEASEIHLWPRDWNTREQPRIGIGIGVRL